MAKYIIKPISKNSPIFKTGFILSPVKKKFKKVKTKEMSCPSKK